MPRKSRIDAPGALQYVIGRAINRRAIFSEKADYKVFLERLGEILSETLLSFPDKNRDSELRRDRKSFTRGLTKIIFGLVV